MALNFIYQVNLGLFLLIEFSCFTLKIRVNSIQSQLYRLDLQKVMITCLDLNLAGDGVDCTDQYVEILDGDTVDALSLGKYAVF